MDGGGTTATVCLLVYAAALPLSVGQRVIVGMGRSATQVISTGVVSPALTCMLLAAVVARLDAGNAVPVMSYLANTLVSVVCVVMAWYTTRPLLRQAVRDVPRLRSARGGCWGEAGAAVAPAVASVVFSIAVSSEDGTAWLFCSLTGGSFLHPRRSTWSS